MAEPLLCIAAAGKTITLAAAAFTLAWTHSVEKTRWEESWRIEEGRLRLAEARIQGSGAGMEPPEGAVLRDGWWRYVPALPPQTELRLAASGTTGAGWTLCAAGQCQEIGATEDAATVVRACP